MNTYEQCLTTENDGGFLYNFLFVTFIIGFSATVASIFVVEHVWKPMIMSDEEIKEVELELEETNKDIPYEDRYPISENESEFADYEDISGSSGVSDSEEHGSESGSQSGSESESESGSRNGSQSGSGDDNQDSDMIFEMEKSEDSDEISSGELIEKPTESEGDEDKQNQKEESNSESESDSESEKKMSDSEINKLADDFVNQMIDDSVDIIKKEIKKKIKLQKKQIKARRKQEFEERLERVHLMKIIEHTPLGNVLMYYDNNQKTFCYYGPKSIPFKYLETVARKYVQIFNCKLLYVDTKKELEKAEKLEKEKREREEMEHEDKSGKDDNSTEKNDDVFATFKTYKNSSRSSNASIADIDHKSDIQNIKRLIDDKNDKK